MPDFLPRSVQDAVPVLESRGMGLRAEEILERARAHGLLQELLLHGPDAVFASAFLRAEGGVRPKGALEPVPMAEAA